MMETKEQIDTGKPNDEEIEDLDWSPDQEILLLYSLHGYKPVGPVRYFNMFVIQDRLCSAMNKPISSKAIWKKLNNMYDLEALDEAEAELSATEKVDIDFVLPETEYGELMAAKIAGKGFKIKVENEDEEGQNVSEELDLLTEIKLEPQTDELDKDQADPPKGAGVEKNSKKEITKRQGKKNNSTLLKDIAVKKENIRETARKDSPLKKEATKEIKKSGTKEDDKKELGKKNTQDVKKDIGKEDKKEAPNKFNKRESTVKSVAEQAKRETELKKNEQKKTPTQRGGTNQSRCETPKQTLETNKRSEAAKTLRSETPKSLRADATAKPQRVDSLRKDSTSDKKKDTPDRGESKSPEKTPDSVRGSKLRTREKKTTEPETPATKRERSRDSTSKETPAEEPPAKKAKLVVKGRPTRNSLEPQQKPASPVSSPQKRRARP